MENRRPLVIAFLIAVLVFGIVVAGYLLRGGDDVTQVADRIQPAAPVIEDADAAREAREANEVRIQSPSFDVVRVDAAGTAVIAGRGHPGARAVVMANGTPLFDVSIDERGEWVAIVDDPLPAGSIEISLLQRLDDGSEMRSDQVVVVSVPEGGASRPLVVLGRPGGPTEVLQSPLDDEGVTFALLAVDYDEAGAVIFSGRSEPSAGVRVLTNGRKIAEGYADAAGRWSITAGATLEPGVYDLQVDQLDAEGRVTAVVVLPFERASLEDLADIGPRTVIVQPGNSLWRIARRLYGSGWQYSVIYAANQDQIRDPDLIYPGQVFRTPEEQDDTRG